MPDLQKSLPNSISFQREGTPIVNIANSTLVKMRDLAEKYKSTETGGILVGYNMGSDIQVIDASDAGPRADRSSAHFLRDTQYCREFLSKCFEENCADYVGEWHTHVNGPRDLSTGDISTLAGILLDPDYDFSSFTMCLLVRRWRKWELLVYVVTCPVQEKRNQIAVTELYRGRIPKI